MSLLLRERGAPGEQRAQLDRPPCAGEPAGIPATSLLSGFPHAQPMRAQGERWEGPELTALCPRPSGLGSGISLSLRLPVLLGDLFLKAKATSIAGLWSWLHPCNPRIRTTPPGSSPSFARPLRPAHTPVNRTIIECSPPFSASVSTMAQHASQSHRLLHRL